MDENLTERNCKYDICKSLLPIGIKVSNSNRTILNIQDLILLYKNGKIKPQLEALIIEAEKLQEQARAALREVDEILK